MSSVSLGFKVPSPELISLVSYDVQINGNSILEDGEITNIAWNDRSGIEVNMEITIDLPAVLNASALSDASELGGFITWKSSGSRLHGASSPTRLENGENFLNLVLPGELLGQTLTLKPVVVLLSRSKDIGSALGATRTGSRLWEHSLIVTLEGTGSQFPTSAVDFARNGIEPANALWRLQIDGELDYHFSSAVRLYLNSGHPRVHNYLGNPTSLDQSEFHSFVRANVIIQLLTFAFNSDLEQLRISADEQGTLAEALLEIHNTYFNSVSIDENQDRFKYDPGFLSATVIGHTFAQAISKKRK